jgi:multiple sugar transport system substrate-binding protein
MVKKSLSRRQFLIGAASVSGAAILVACAPQVVEKTVQETVEVPVQQTVEVPVQQTVQVPVQQTVIVTAPAPAGPVVLTCAHVWEAAFEAHQEEFDNNFMKDHPNIFIKRINSEYDSHNQIIPTWAAADELPDIIYVHGSRAYPWNQQGILITVDNYVTADTAFDVAGIWPEALKLYQYKGKQFEIPYDHGAIILGYNIDIFDAAKVEYPNENWTFDDLLATAKKLTVPGKHWGYSGYYDNTLDLDNENGIMMVGGWGGAVFTDDESKLVIDSPESVEALKWWVNLYTEKVVPNAAEATGFPSGVWLSGATAMWGLPTWDVPTLHDFGNFKYDVAPWPKGPVAHKTGSFGSGYGITKDSKNPDTAWTYLSSYLSVDGMNFMWAASGRGSPARLACKDTYMKAPINPPHAGYFYDALDTYAVTGHPYHTSVSAEVIDILDKYCGLVRSGGMKIEDAIANILKEANPKLAAAAEQS